MIEVIDKALDFIAQKKWSRLLRANHINLHLLVLAFETWPDQIKMYKNMERMNATFIRPFS